MSGIKSIEDRLLCIYPKENSRMKGFYWNEHHVGNDVWYFSTYLSFPEGNLEVLYYL